MHQLLARSVMRRLVSSSTRNRFMWSLSSPPSAAVIVWKEVGKPSSESVVMMSGQRLGFCGQWWRMVSSASEPPTKNSTSTVAGKEGDKEAKRSRASVERIEGEDEVAVSSYWGISRPKITKQDGSVWPWNCFMPWETYQADLSIDLSKHHLPKTLLDKVAYWTVKLLRIPTDLFFKEPCSDVDVREMFSLLHPSLVVHLFVIGNTCQNYNSYCFMDYPKNQLIQNAILATVDATIGSTVASATNAKAAWDALHTAYANKSQTRIFSLKDRLAFVSKDSRPVADYLHQVRSLCDELATAGSPHEDAKKTPSVPITANIAKGTTSSPKRQGSTNQQNNNRRSNAPNQQNNYHSWRDNQQPQHNNQQQSSNNNLYCQLCDRRGHTARVCRTRSHNHLQKRANYDASLQNQSTPWIVDSGATHHMASDTYSLATMQNYHGLDEIVMDNGNTIPITHTGNILSQISTSTPSTTQVPQKQTTSASSASQTLPSRPLITYRGREKPPIPSQTPHPPHNPFAPAQNQPQMASPAPTNSSYST
ncbi:Ubiquinol oxidase 2, mitochondrial [Capsicum annuum]|nr:Ubiquinol oxidase 2, mitochondrial [Capsicum annuum]